ncbi:MAG: ribosome-associated translation inhibitor RaiA [Acidobacteria bacterium]|nr:ribosome-associated translation inhibitor RaiA [Acidobacteriota bacterium]
MNVEITGRHVDITPAIRAYVMKRLRKFVKILGEDISFHVIITVQKVRQTADILLKSKFMDLAGKGQTDDMYASIIQAIDKLERQALKQKSKIIEGKRQRAKENSVAVKSGTVRPPKRSSASKAESIREEEAYRKPMTVEEALIELNQSDYPFIVFRNSESGIVNVLYRRKDSSLGLIRT